MKEFRLVDEEKNIYGEFDGIVLACRECNKIKGTMVEVMDLKTKTVKEVLTSKAVEYLANYKATNCR